MRRRNLENRVVQGVFWRIGGGLLLALVAVVGLSQAVRASWAYVLMHEANFGPSRHDSEKALRISYQAQRKYPYSYHLAIYAGSLAWNQYLRTDDDGDAALAEVHLDKVRYWTRVGLHQNPYPIQLRWFKKRLLEMDDSVDAAIAYWEAHTDWHFWDAYNHAVLADLYTHAGRFEDAERALRMLTRSPHYAEAAAALKAARASAAGEPSRD